MKNDEFGDRMKAFERETRTFVSLSKPICVRIDGKRFSKFTKFMNKPYDLRMMNSMKSVTTKLMEMFHADAGYTQSDEITLIFFPKGEDKICKIVFDGNIQKITSVFAAMTSVLFVREASFFIPETSTPVFDARIWNVPDIGEAVNVLLWRMKDAVRNSVSCFYRYSIGHREMQNKKRDEMISDMRDKGVGYDETNEYFKSGYFILKDRKSEEGRYNVFPGQFFLNMETFSERLNFVKEEVLEE